jgi:anaerobic dimethyl sulfoxide reductase subunit A
MSDQTLLEDLAAQSRMSRRSFMKWSAAMGGTAAVMAGVDLPFQALAADNAAPGSRVAATGSRVVWSSCMVNCGSRCPLRVHVNDGTIVRVETDNTGDDEIGNHQVRSCVRGRSIRQRIYNPDRLKYPMKRVGKRGSGEFERISWEEAFDTIADKLKEVVEEYGNEAVYINYATGTLGGTVSKSWPPGSSPIARLMNCYGGYLNLYGTYSTAQISAALPYTYGSGANNSVEDIMNTKLVVLVGNNPAETRMSGGGIIPYLRYLKEQTDVKVIMIDPRFNDTTVTVVDEWIPIRPGTDAALVSAMAYVMITENLHDKEFLDTYCVGFDEAHMPEGIPRNNSYESYILGRGEDRTAKTPEWAAEITGIPAATIVRLAREIALTKPAYISQGWGPQRHANGEQSARAIAMLSILTGNVGLHGGSTGANFGSFGVGVRTIPTLSNPVNAAISVFMWPDAIMRGPEMTALADGVRGVDQLSVPIKFMWNYAGNCIINQHSDVNLTRQILEDDTQCEMIVVIENHMTSSAMMADILLPDITNFEQNEVTTNGAASNMGYAIYLEQAIEPMWECRSVYEMCTEIATRLGVAEEFTEGRSHDDWLEYCVELTRENNPDFPDVQSLKEMGIYKVKNPGDPSVPHKAFREDPEENPLNTPSGKIEIFSERLYEMGRTWELPEGDVITGLPIYAPTWEMPGDPLEEKYPLQCVGHHYKQRTHSTFGNVEWLQEACPQEVWINPIDAEARGIAHGDLVIVYNDRGKIRLPAKVTPRVMPGVLDVPQGAWYRPDQNGIDEGGNINTLTRYHPSPLAKGNPQHTNLVEVEKA